MWTLRKKSGGQNRETLIGSVGIHTGAQGSTEGQRRVDTVTYGKT